MTTPTQRALLAALAEGPILGRTTSELAAHVYPKGRVLIGRSSPSLRTAALLWRLHRAGLVENVFIPSHGGSRWLLTDAGRAAAA